MQSFQTHTGEIISGKRLGEALNAVADWYAANAYAVRKEDAYASHVTDSQKERHLNDQLQLAERIRNNQEPCGFWLWQRLDAHITGEWIAFLPK